MASGVTNRGKYLILYGFYRGGATFNARLTTTTIDVDDNVETDYTEASNYTAETLTGNGTDFPTITEDDTGDQAYVVTRDLVYAVSGGDMSGVTFQVINENSATEQIISFHDLSGPITVSNGQSLTVQNTQISAVAPA